MQTLNGGYSPGFMSAPVSNNAFFDDWTTQMAITEASRRLSRGSSGQRSGSAMRVSKPSSANNSPIASMVPGRRRTTVNDNHPYRRPQNDQYSRLGFDAGRPSRPVSWHPSTYLYTPQTYLHHQQAACYPLSTPNMYADHSDMDSAYPQLSPMLTSYSTNASPCSSFSPLPLAYHGSAAPQYLSPDSWDYSQSHTPGYPQPEAPPALTHAPNLSTPAGHSMDWNNYIVNGTSNTTPPTPESFVHPQQAQPAVSEDAVPYQPLEDEDEGEILVGMGLYDTPEKCEEDPQLNNYRSTISSLLGSTYRPREPMGKGLTLEQAWEPPKSDDEDDDDEDEDEAGDEDDAAVVA